MIYFEILFFGNHIITILFCSSLLYSDFHFYHFSFFLKTFFTISYTVILLEIISSVFHTSENVLLEILSLFKYILTVYRIQD